MKAKQSDREYQELDQLLVNLIQKKQPPNIIQALKNKEKKSIKFNCKYSLYSDEQSWHEFGPGVKLYFSLLRYLTFLFFILFINALPSLICNLKGNGLDIYHDKAVSHFKIDMMKASLANIPLASLGHNFTSEIEKNIDEIHSHTVFYRRIVTLNDIWLTIILLGFFVFWEIKSKSIINQDTKNIDLPSYRTLIMQNIFSDLHFAETSFNEMIHSPDEKQTQRKLNEIFRPQNLSIEELWELKIKRHFQKFCKVDSVTIMYDYGETLQQLMDFNQIVIQYSELSEDSEKQGFLYELLKMKFELIKSDYLNKTKDNIKKFDVPFLPKKAFITFHTKEDRNRIKSLYKYKINEEQLKFSLHESNFSQIENKKLIPKIKKCRIEPVSITWENFHRKGRQEIKGTCFIGSFVCVVLCLALVAILLLSMKMAGLIDKTWHFQPSQNVSEMMEAVIQHPTYEQAVHTSNLKTLYNFCSSLQLSYSTFHMEYYNLCEEYFTNFTEQSITMLVLSGLILIINLILNYIIYALVDYRRYRTTTQKNRFLIMNIFLVYLVNMILIILLIRADFDDNNDTSTSLVHIIKVIFPQFETHRKIETYPEFNRKWYIHIGNQLLYNYVVSLIICPWLYIGLYWTFEKGKLILTKFKTFCRHQTQLNEMLLPQKFDFQIFYAMVLVSFYFCMIFGTGMPIFYLLGAVSFLSLYLANQFIFYHFCRVPEPFDHSINALISKILFFGLAIHQIVAIFFLYVKDIFPEKQSFEGPTHISIYSISQKLREGWVFFLMFGIVLVFYFIKKKVCSLVKKKYFLQDQTKELNEQHIMKEIDINAEELHQNSMFPEDQIKKSEIIDESLHNRGVSDNNLNEFKSQFLQKYYYRMQDNKIYTNIYYTLTVFHKIVYNQQFRVPSKEKIQFEFQPSNTKKEGTN